jgi:hypothetical protein
MPSIAVLPFHGMDVVALRGVQRSRPPRKTQTFSDETPFVPFWFCTIREPAEILHSSECGGDHDDVIMENITAGQFPFHPGIWQIRSKRRQALNSRAQTYRKPRSSRSRTRAGTMSRAARMSHA